MECEICGSYGHNTISHDTDTSWFDDRENERRKKEIEKGIRRYGSYESFIYHEQNSSEF